MVLRSQALAVSAPARTAGHLVRAPDGPVRVLHHSSSAVYVQVAGRCVGVVTAEAAQVPCALRLAVAPSGPPSRAPGVSSASILAAGPMSLYVERGTLHLSGHPLRIGRFVDVRVPRIDPSRVLRAASPATAMARLPRPAAGGAGLAGHSHTPTAPPADSRPVAPVRVQAALHQLPPLGSTIDRALLQSLVGNGGGLTPLGDDVLCGWLAVLVATGRLTHEIDQAVRALLDRTTVLSATLIDCALHGEVLPEFGAYLAAVGTTAEDDAAGALTRIGHTSGVGLWWGARHALTILAAEETA